MQSPLNLSLTQIADFQLSIANLLPESTSQFSNWQLEIGNTFSQLKSAASFRRRVVYRHYQAREAGVARDEPSR